MNTGFSRGALAGVLIAMLLTGDASAAKKPAPPVRCNKLHGTVVLKTAQIKVTETKKGAKTLTRACALPRGIARTVLNADAQTKLTYDKTRTAGTWFAYTDRFGTDDNFAHYLSIDMFDAATGAYYSLWEGETDAKGGGGEVVLTLDAYFFDKYGRAATAQHDNEGDVVESIRAFAPDGTAVVLDKGSPTDVPVSSLNYDIPNFTINWTHSGEARSATFETDPDKLR